jgi:hypothetical protein
MCKFTRFRSTTPPPGNFQTAHAGIEVDGQQANAASEALRLFEVLIAQPEPQRKSAVMPPLARFMAGCHCEKVS